MSKLQSYVENPAFWRWLVSLGGIWRVLEILSFSSWSHQVSPWTVQPPENFWLRWHPVIGSQSEMIFLGMIIIASYLIWGLKGKAWGFLPFLLAPLIAHDNLPMGWGLLSIQPFILLLVLGEQLHEKTLTLWRWITIFQIIWIYGSSLLNKDYSVWWSEGTAMAMALNGDYLPTWLGRSIYQFLIPMGLLSHLSRGIVVVQFSALLLPLIVFMKGFGKWLKLCLLMLASFHLMVLLLLKIGPFSLGCIGLLGLPLIKFPKSVDVHQNKALHLLLSSIYIFSLYLGINRPSSLSLWHLGIVQAWNIMQTPEKPGHFIFELKDTAWSTEKLKDKRGYALAYALSTNDIIRNAWLKAGCSKRKSDIIWTRDHSLSVKEHPLVFSCSY